METPTATEGTQEEEKELYIFADKEEPLHFKGKKGDGGKENGREEGAGIKWRGKRKEKEREREPRIQTCFESGLFSSIQNDLCNLKQAFIRP